MAEPGARVRVEVWRGDSRTVQWFNARTTLGRAAACTLKLSDLRVSGHHAHVAVDGDLVCWVTDTSQNGTFLNGARLTKDVATRLYPGDIISLVVSGCSLHPSLCTRAQRRSLMCAMVVIHPLDVVLNTEQILPTPPKNSAKLKRITSFFKSPPPVPDFLIAPQPVRGDAHPSDPGEIIACACASADADVLMHDCDGCHRWFHDECTGAAGTGAWWLCYECEHEELQSLLMASALHCVLSEVEGEENVHVSSLADSSIASRRLLRSPEAARLLLPDMKTVDRLSRTCHSLRVLLTPWLRSAKHDYLRVQGSPMDRNEIVGCFCGGGATPGPLSMLACDTCARWFHVPCVFEHGREPSSLSLATYRWTCYECRPRSQLQEAPMTTHLPTLLSRRALHALSILCTFDLHTMPGWDGRTVNSLSMTCHTLRVPLMPLILAMKKRCFAA